jgi:SAM-dependent methyltransferase
VKRTARLALRNEALLLEVLRAHLPAAGELLELGSGTGEHAVAIARAFPAVTVQPSDPDPEARASIAAWRREAGLPNLRRPLDLDVAERPWRRRRADALLAVNLLHLAPPEAADALVAGAVDVLAPGGPLVLYGPFLPEGPPPPRLARFDAELRAHHPSIGLRPIAPLVATARAGGLALVERREGVEEGDVVLVFRRAG